MLDITIRVTKGPAHLTQVHQISVQNLGYIEHEDDLCEYRIFLDGQVHSTVFHNRKDGALVLTRKVMDKIV